MEELPVVETETGYAFGELPNGVDEDRPLDFHFHMAVLKVQPINMCGITPAYMACPPWFFRQSCIYGPRQMGVEDQGWLAWFIIALVTGRSMTIYGNGKQVRDLLYIEDLVDACELAVEHIEVTAGQVYNMGGGSDRAISVWWDFKPLVEKALGHSVDPAFGEMRPGDQPSLSQHGESHPGLWMVAKRHSRTRCPSPGRMGPVQSVALRVAVQETHAYLLGLTYYRPYVSGLTIYVERLGKALAERGHDVTVLSTMNQIWREKSSSMASESCGFRSRLE